MKVTYTYLIEIIREALEQDLRGRLDPQAGHMSNLEGSDPGNHYMMWAKTNGLHPADTRAVASYALEQSLESDGLEVREIIQHLSLGVDAIEDVKQIINSQERF